MRIPYLDLQRQNAHYQTAIDAAALRVLHSGRYLQGEENKHFSDEFAAYVGAKHCVPMSNGLDGLVITLKALKDLHGWEDSDEVIVPAFTFIASAEAIRLAGLIPVLCDISDRDWLLDVRQVEALISSRTRALLPVHLYGKVCEMDTLAEIAQKHHLFLIEDAAQAHGATYRGRNAGTLGVAAVFSFYPGKNLGAIGDAGAVVTNDATLAERIRAMANYGAIEKYHHQYVGHNARMDEVQAAILSAKLPFLTKENERRREIARRYFSEIHHPRLRLPYSSMEEESVYHIFAIFAEERNKLQAVLAEKGIETLLHYPQAIHEQASFADWADKKYPTASFAARHCLSLPLYPSLTTSEVDYIIQSVNTANW